VLRFGAVSHASPAFPFAPAPIRTEVQRLSTDPEDWRLGRRDESAANGIALELHADFDGTIDASVARAFEDTLGESPDCSRDSQEQEELKEAEHHG
jgi:hypothetical protein